MHSINNCSSQGCCLTVVWKRCRDGALPIRWPLLLCIIPTLFAYFLACHPYISFTFFIFFFNPIHPHICNKLTALSALQRLLNAVMCLKEVEASSFSLWRYIIYVQYCYSGCWLCSTSFKARCSSAGCPPPQNVPQGTLCPLANYEFQPLPALMVGDLVKYETRNV